MVNELSSVLSYLERVYVLYMFPHVFIKILDTHHVFYSCCSFHFASYIVRKCSKNSDNALQYEQLTVYF